MGGLRLGVLQSPVTCNMRDIPCMGGDHNTYYILLCTGKWGDCKFPSRLNRGIYLFRYFLSLMHTPHLSRQLHWADVFVNVLSQYVVYRKYLNRCTPLFDVSLWNQSQEQWYDVKRKATKQELRGCMLLWGKPELEVIASFSQCTWHWLMRSQTIRSVDHLLLCCYCACHMTCHKVITLP